MPHEIMKKLHEAGMPGSHHWLFWVVVAAVFAVLLYLVWRFGISRGKRSK